MSASTTISASGVPFSTGPFEAVVVGASLGGPGVIQRLLAALPASFPLPIAICQHMTDGITGAWAERLDHAVPLEVIEAYDRAAFEPGCVYIGPAGRHLTVERGPHGLRLRLRADTTGAHHVPSIDALFASAADTVGSGAVAVLLTGLGHDGADGMTRVRNSSGYTIAQSSEEASAASMPDSADARGAVVERLGIGEIAQRLVELTSSAR